MTIRNPNAARTAFERALIALDKLHAANIPVHAVLYCGQKPVLVIDKAPAFVKGVLKMRQMVDGDMQYTYAAPFHGTQLEWHVNKPVLKEAGNA